MIDSIPERRRSHDHRRARGIRENEILPPPSIGVADVVYTYNAGTLSISHSGAPSNLDVNDGKANGTIQIYRQVYIY